jgi:hypothetical protein
MADQYLALDVKAVEQQINWLVSEYPDLADDEALRADMLEGETGLHAILSRVLDHRQEAVEVLTGIKARKQDITDRQSRYERRKDAMTTLIKRLMDVAGQDRVMLPEATISVTKGRESVLITDESELPQGFVKIVREPKKTEILASLQAGETVPGAALQFGENGITVRTK